MDTLYLKNVSTTTRKLKDVKGANSMNTECARALLIKLCPISQNKNIGWHCQFFSKRRLPHCSPSLVWPILGCGRGNSICVELTSISRPAMITQIAKRPNIGHFAQALVSNQSKSWWLLWSTIPSKIWERHQVDSWRIVARTTKLLIGA